PALKIILFIAIIILIEYYAFVSLRLTVKSLAPTYKYLIQGFYLLFTLAWVAVLFSFPSLRNSDVAKPLMNIGLVFFMAFLFLKVMMASFMAIDDIKRVGFWVSSLFYNQNEIPTVVENGMTRSAFLR